MVAVTILIDALSYAGWLFIVALGLTLVFGVLKILNIAHGSFYALGAYAAASFVTWAAAMKLAPAFAIVAMLLAAVAVAALVAPLTERGLLRFFYGRDEVLLVLVTYALFLVLEDVTKLVWGANPYYVSEPYTMFGNVEIGSQVYVGYDGSYRSSFSSNPSPSVSRLPAWNWSWIASVRAMPNSGSAIASVVQGGSRCHARSPGSRQNARNDRLPDSTIT